MYIKIGMDETGVIVAVRIGYDSLRKYKLCKLDNPLSGIAASKLKKLQKILIFLIRWSGLTVDLAFDPSQNGHDVRQGGFLDPQRLEI